MTDALDERVEEVESRIGSLSELAIANDGDIEALEQEVGSLRQEIDALRSDLAEIQDIYQMLQPEEDTRKTKEQRAAITLASLYRKAENARTDTAALDAAGVATANNEEIKRSYGAEVMEAVPELVGDRDVCWIIREERNAPDNTRVVLDLSNHGPSVLPASSGGVRIRGGATADD